MSPALHTESEYTTFKNNIYPLYTDMADIEHRNKIEAVLFTSGQYMCVEEIAQVCGIGSVGYVKEVIIALQKEYEEQHTALSIFEMDGKYKLNIKKAYGELVNRLVSGDDLDNPTTKTLAVIAYKHPAFQNEIIKIRGNKAYDHIHRLIEGELINSQKHGR